MDARFSILKSLNAGDFQHLNGDLESHLKATAKLLKSWGAPQVLQTAGLFHAAYGTSGFNQSMVSLNQRNLIATAIGKREEALVYLYCSCDREIVFPQFGDNTKPIDFRDRFTGNSFRLTQKMASMFCELTAANELELVYSSESFKQEHGKGLFNLLSQMDEYLSRPARIAFKSALSSVA